MANVKQKYDKPANVNKSVPWEQLKTDFCCVKKLLWALVIASTSILSSCGNKLVTINNAELKKLTADSLSGTWMPEEYLMAVEHVKSIWGARDVTFSFFVFWLDKENLLSDSAAINGATEHEGGYTADLKFDSATGKFINDLDVQVPYRYIDEPFEIRLISTNLLEIYFINSNSRELYRKVNNLDEELNRILMAGNYTDIKTEETITLNADGTIVSTWNENHYALVYDFMEGIEFDAVQLYNDKERSSEFLNTLYHFKFSGDTLRLFPAVDQLGDFNYTIGNPVKTLIRQQPAL